MYKNYKKVHTLIKWLDMCQHLKTSHIINVCELETSNGLKHI